MVFVVAYGAGIDSTALLVGLQRMGVVPDAILLRQFDIQRLAPGPLHTVLAVRRQHPAPSPLQPQVDGPLLGGGLFRFAEAVRRECVLASRTATLKPTFSGVPARDPGLR